jgi:hypothetical protein
MKKVQEASRMLPNFRLYDVNHNACGVLRPEDFYWDLTGLVEKWCLW